IRPTSGGRQSSPEFIARLMEYRHLFSSSKPPKVKPALMALRPEKREDLDGSWQGTCQLRMWGEIAAERGAQSAERRALRASRSALASEAGGPGEVVLHLGFRTARPTEETLARGKWLQSCVINQAQSAHAPAY